MILPHCPLITGRLLELTHNTNTLLLAQCASTIRTCCSHLVLAFATTLVIFLFPFCSFLTRNKERQYPCRASQQFTADPPFPKRKVKKASPVTTKLSGRPQYFRSLARPERGRRDQPPPSRLASPPGGSSPHVAHCRITSCSAARCRLVVSYFVHAWRCRGPDRSTGPDSESPASPSIMSDHVCSYM